MSHAATSRTRRTLRILIPALLVLVWLTVAAIGGPYFGKVSEVSSNDPTAYLPTTAEATQVQERRGPTAGANGSAPAPPSSADHDRSGAPWCREASALPRGWIA